MTCTATQKRPSDAEWQQIDQTLQHFMQSVVLEIDGYRVVLCLERVSQFSNAIKVFVDGAMKGEWFRDFIDGKGDGVDIVRRFYPKRKRSIWNEKQKKQLVRIYGLRKARKEHGLDKTIEIPGCYWTNFNSLKKQLLAENQQIRLIKESIAA